MNKTILGLDLGVTSIGWAVINETENSNTIIDLGSRIIPLSTEDKDEFSKGNAISKNQKRTIKRTQRKGYDRYQLRRENLKNFLQKIAMLPSERLMNLNSLELYGLRSKAVKEKIELEELGRVLYLLNQKRGYKSSRSDANADKKDTEYVAEVKGRHQQISDMGLTIGQYFFKQLENDKFYKIKEQVFPREAYIEEFDAICKEQKKHHSKILSEEAIKELRNEIIYYQRKLKSQKGLVSICELEGIERQDSKGKAVFTGPKVSPRSSPLFQLCSIWEVVNNITLKIKNDEGSKYKWSDYFPTLEQKNEIVSYLMTNSILTLTELLKILNLKKENVYVNKQIAKGIKGNTTYSEVSSKIENVGLLNFHIEVEKNGKQSFLVDKKSGEVIEQKDVLVVTTSVEKEPLYQLWHTIYSIKDIDECKNALIKKFQLSDEEAIALSKIDFTKQSFGNKSSKAIRKILPFLMQGYNYADASTFAGYNHSNSLTKDEKENLTTVDSLELLSKNSLRQPVVEKIINQMVNLVNAIIIKYGKPDEIRVELARELKQSKEERNDTDKQNSLNKKLNDLVASRLQEHGIKDTKRNREKYKFIFPTKEKKWNEAQTVNQCIYCGETFNLTEALSGNNFDVDHIVPKSLLFDDSQTNKVLVHRKCNKDKTNSTAFDYISTTKTNIEVTLYLERVDDWFKRGIISYPKMLRLKVSYKDYLERKKQKKETEADKWLWENFIDRQLRESAYIARKAKQLLQKICNYVHSTEGNVTAKLRKLWGWEDVLLELQLPKYKELHLTELKEWESENGKRKHKREEIKDWSKRDDHRHHALDALTIACTKQGFIQRLNTLSASETKDAMRKEIEKAEDVFKEKMSELDKYLVTQKPLTTTQVKNAIEQILISFKSGKRVATISKLKAKGKNESTGIITPRGSLSEESVYGKIKTLDKNKTIKYLFENTHLILKPYIKQVIEERIVAHNGDIKQAFASIKKEPIYLDTEKTKLLEYGTCYKNEYVIKYPLINIKAKDVEFIIDAKVREAVKERLEKFNNKEKEAFKDLEDNPVWFNMERKIPIKTVRCFTGLSAVEPVKKDANGTDIGFVKPGNNHHIAIYKDEAGKLQEHLCTFWHAVERKKYKLPIIIKKPSETWEKIGVTENYSQDFLNKLPDSSWQYVESLQQNEMFILGMSNEDFEKAINDNDRALLSKHLYRIQKMSNSDYWVRHHLETQINDSIIAKDSKRYFRFNSVGAFFLQNPIKISINNIGEIKVFS